MPDLTTEGRRYRQRILTADSAAAARLTRAYAEAFRRIDIELESLTARIAQARMEGSTVTPDVLYRERRLQRLRALVLDEVTRFSGRAATWITGDVTAARALGAEGALGLVDRVTPPAVTPTSLFPAALPTSAVVSAVATFRTQAIRALLAPLGEAVARKVEDAVVSAVIRGVNPRDAAREVRQHLGGGLERALTISRTEMMRAHREGALAEYRANANVVDGWVWVAGLGARTCASCYAQHGTVHPLDEAMASHPRCRCVAVPHTRSWESLGFTGGEEPAPVASGASLFRGLPRDRQRAVLRSDSAVDAYRSGRVRLEDFVHRDASPVWGASSRAAGLREARENAAARRAA